MAIIIGTVVGVGYFDSKQRWEYGIEPPITILGFFNLSKVQTIFYAE